MSNFQLPNLLKVEVQLKESIKLLFSPCYINGVLDDKVYIFVCGSYLWYTK